MQGNQRGGRVESPSPVGQSGDMLNNASIRMDSVHVHTVRSTSCHTPSCAYVLRTPNGSSARDWMIDDDIHLTEGAQAVF